jgi:ketosteroid isomerase-like protein
MADDPLERLLAESEIREVLFRYCRGIDRLDLAAVRDCYHPDAIDDHGRYNGTVDGFVAWLPEALAPFASTTHFIGNVLVERDGDVAHVESYCLALHRTAGAEPADRTANLRYLDRFERRAGAWRIAHRRCVYQPGRVDAVAVDYPLADKALRAARGPQDPVYRR